MEKQKYWIWLSRIDGLGPIKIKELLKIYNSPEVIWNLTKEELMNVDGIGENIANKILYVKYRQNLEQYVSYMQKYNIGVISIQDEEYPENLKNIYDSPIVLYYKGNINLLKNSRIIAMVGCRKCSNYGKNVTLKLAQELSQKGICIASGMAIGIDSYSHTGCINAGGKTIAILGSGVDVIYPKENTSLYSRILKTGGLILSEYVIGTKPTKISFPARNRIISGISKGVIVVEAKEKSGTLNTVDFALEQGREVFVVPRKYYKSKFNWYK
jgi:DNA processing protein